MSEQTTIPPSPYLLRQSRLSSALISNRLNALVLNPGPSLTYLTGLHFHLMERPVVAIFVPNSQPILVLPELETAKVRKLPYPLQAFPYGEDPAGWPGVFKQAVLAAGIGERLVGVEPTRLRFLELRYLEDAAPKAQFRSAEGVISALRSRKDSAEIEAMRQAVKIAENALLATLPTIHAGTSEQQIANELTLQLLRAGSDPEFPFSPIVAGGPNSANPHATPSDRLLQPGDLLIIDWGAIHNGYVSDLTRTLAIGPVDEELKKIARIVMEANAAGRNAVMPGAAASDVDQAARQVIEKAGYGQYFIHRTGHGLGMEGHEEPYIRSGNATPLDAGMTFTVEPGIYLPERGGVRIEDNVVVTSDGYECLSSLPRELKVIQ